MRNGAGGLGSQGQEISYLAFAEFHLGLTTAPWVSSVLFPCVNQFPLLLQISVTDQLKGRNIYFGSQLSRFQPLVLWAALLWSFNGTEYYDERV